MKRNKKKQKKLARHEGVKMIFQCQFLRIINLDLFLPIHIPPNTGNDNQE